ncbi:set domain containing protein [Niveomyces insectorum RCEF 264]|uniref:Set domain containing protein n=1 Tax=Niveomyces insectorum RCEF 264 TaxID=1081102 RepID=A0A167QU49_9HYPO|nr:set domain containing protein [Niveomyces insectorum RCEF 264]
MSLSEEDERLEKLLHWSQAHGGRVHAGLEVYRDAATGLSLRVRPDHSGLAEGATVVFCPLSTSLSYLNALSGGPLLMGTQPPQEPAGESTSVEASAEFSSFPPAFVAETAPHVVGRFFLVQQHLLGAASPWYAYLATLPRPDEPTTWALPAVWGRSGGDGTARALALLAGTNASTAAAEMRTHIDAEFAAAQERLQRLGFAAAPAYTQRLYDWAFCVFTSRSFRPSLVLDPDVQAVLRGLKSSGGDDDDDDGSPLPRLPASCQIDDFSLLLPVLDLANHDPTAAVRWVTSGAGAAEAAEDPEAPEAPGAEKAAPTPGVAFCVDQPYAPGQQVFNNYGAKTNSELLLGYGFVLRPTPALHNDYVHLRKRGAAATPSTGAGPQATLPQDFLLSLRPLDDASSPVGAARQWRQPVVQHGQASAPADAPTGPVLPPAFGRFEDALLWDLCTQLWTADEQQALQAATVERIDATAPLTAQRAMVLSCVFGDAAEPAGPGESDDSCPWAGLVDRVRQTLLAKVGMDYERLEEADDDGNGYAEEEEEEGNDDNEEQHPIRLARAYREQYRTVIIAALTALDPELEVVEGT